MWDTIKLAAAFLVWALMLNQKRIFYLCVFSEVEDLLGVQKRPGMVQLLKWVAVLPWISEGMKLGITQHHWKYFPWFGGISPKSATE